MRRTEKIVKVHAECTCGHNEHHQHNTGATHRELTKFGYKRRKLASGNPVYILKISEDCKGDIAFHHEP